MRHLDGVQCKRRCAVELRKEIHVWAVKDEKQLDADWQISLRSTINSSHAREAFGIDQGPLFGRHIDYLWSCAYQAASNHSTRHIDLRQLHIHLDTLISTARHYKHLRTTCEALITTHTNPHSGGRAVCNKVRELHTPAWRHNYEHEGVGQAVSIVEQPRHGNNVGWRCDKYIQEAT